MKRELVVFEEPKSPVSEIFRSLRTNIQFTGDENKKIKTILITSTFTGEGKSWTAANLAVAFAQADNKVVLVDADMRRGRQHKLFDVDPLPGFSNYLSRYNANGQRVDVNMVECIRETNIPNLVVLPAGFVPENPAELLLTDRTTKILNELKRSANIVIIDAPPSTMVADSIILSRLVDGIILVVEQGQSKSENLKKITKDIKHVGGNILGVVMNKINTSKKKYSNEYYYYGQKNKLVIK